MKDISTDTVQNWNTAGSIWELGDHLLCHLASVVLAAFWIPSRFGLHGLAYLSVAHGVVVGSP